MKNENKLIELTAQIDGEDVVFKFKQPSKLVFSKAYNSMTENDYFMAVEIIIDNCLQNELDSDGKERMIVLLSAPIIAEFFKFETVNIIDDYKGNSKEYKELKINNPIILTLFAGNYKIFIKPLSRFDYKEIYNRSIISSIDALDYVFNNLKIGGDDIQKNLPVYFSCIKVSEYLLMYKHNSIKKK